MRRAGGFGGNRAYMTGGGRFFLWPFIRSADERADFAEVRAPPGGLFGAKMTEYEKREIGL